MAFTPLAWQLSGKHNENYPEIIFLFYGLPTAIILLLAGVVVFVLGDAARGGPYRSDLGWLWLGLCVTTVLGVAMMLVFLLPESILPPGLAQLTLNYYPLVVLPLDFAIVLFGVWSAFRSK